MIKITVTEKEILNSPNNFDLGELIRNKFWMEKDKVTHGISKNNDSIADTSQQNGKVVSISEKDKCVACGKESPYFRDTHIDRRLGYIEGAGQGCFQPHRCHSV